MRFILNKVFMFLRCLYLSGYVYVANALMETYFRHLRAQKVILGWREI